MPPAENAGHATTDHQGLTTWTAGTISRWGWGLETTGREAVSANMLQV